MAAIDIACRPLFARDGKPNGGWVIVFDIRSPLFERNTPLGKVIYVPRRINPVKSAEERLLDEIRVASRYGWFDGDY